MARQDMVRVTNGASDTVRDLGARMMGLCKLLAAPSADIETFLVADRATLCPNKVKDRSL